MQKLAIALVVASVILGAPPSARAGSEEEVAGTIEQWAKAFNAGDAEAVAALYAPDARLFGILSPERLDGREAIRRYMADGLRAKPQVSLGAEPAIRVYAGVAAVDTGYYEYAATLDGRERHFPARYSFTLVKADGRWMVVDHHSSLVPTPPAAR